MANPKSVSNELLSDTPPRFTIALLMQTTAGIAVLLAILKVLGLDASVFDSESSLVNGRRAILIGIPLALTGFCLCLLAFPVRNFFGARIAFPVFAGHWQLIYHGLLTALVLLAFALQIQLAEKTSAAVALLTLFLLDYLAGGIVWLTAYEKCVDDVGAWREYYTVRVAFSWGGGFFLAGMALLLIFLGRLTDYESGLIAVFFFGMVLDWGFSAIFLIVALYLDWMISVRRDWLHWVGLLDLFAMPACLFFAASTDYVPI